jgi:hypothetical protein
MRVVGLLVALLCFISPPAVSAFIYSQGDVYLPPPLMGEAFTICNGQSFHFPFFRISLRFYPGDHGGYGIHYVYLTEVRTELLTCCGDKQCGIIERAVTFPAKKVKEGLQFTISDSESHVYLFEVEEEKMGWVTIRCVNIYGIVTES